MNEPIQTGAAMAAIGMLGTVAGLAFGWLKDRDKLRHDADMAAIKTQNAGQAQQIANLEKSVADCKEKHADCEEKHQTTEVQIAEIRAMLAAKKDDTSEHKPLKPN